MIDINNIVNSAIQQEVSKIVTDFIDPYIANMKREYQQQIAAMREEVEQLKQQRAASPATGTGGVMDKDATLKLLQDSPDIKQAVYEIAHAAAEAVMADHLEGYDHDEFVTKYDLPEFPDVDTLVTKDDLGDAVRESVRETLENRVSVSLYLS